MARVAQEQRTRSLRGRTEPRNGWENNQFNINRSVEWDDYLQRALFPITSRMIADDGWLNGLSHECKSKKIDCEDRASWVWLGAPANKHKQS